MYFIYITITFLYGLLSLPFKVHVDLKGVITYMQPFTTRLNNHPPPTSLTTDALTLNILISDESVDMFEVSFD